MPRSEETLKLLGVFGIAALALTACGDGGEDGGDAVDTDSEVDFDLDVDIDAGELGLISEGTLAVCSDVPYPPSSTTTTRAMWSLRHRHRRGHR